MGVNEATRILSAEPVSVAVAQLASERDPAENLARAETLINRSVEHGSQVIVFPEYFMSWGAGKHGRREMLEVSQPLDGPFVMSLRRMSREAGIWVIAGIVESPAGGDGKACNTTVLVDAAGELVTVYRKSHLFDAWRYRESAVFAPGNARFQVVTTPLGVTGVFVCYEVRFPEVARALALNGATVLAVPTAWVAGPLKDMHWETLLRARAIENGCYVVAAAQTGHEFAGGSMVIDPMGVVMAQAGEQETVIFADVDPQRIISVRDTVPSLRHRRPELY